MTQDNVGSVVAGSDAVVAPVAEVVKAKRVRKPKAAPKRGRPKVYKGNVVKHIASLVKRYGASGARAILNADAGTDAAAKRSAVTVPNALGISLPTILGIAKDAGVKLERGRRKGSLNAKTIAANAAAAAAAEAGEDGADQDVDGEAADAA